MAEGTPALQCSCNCLPANRGEKLLTKNRLTHTPIAWDKPNRLVQCAASWSDGTLGMEFAENSWVERSQIEVDDLKLVDDISLG